MSGEIGNNINDGSNLRKNSCWNYLAPEWLETAYKFKFSDSIYVQHELLEWLVSFIDKNILHNDWDLRCTVEEIYHHNLDGHVYCIRFYRRLEGTSFASVFNRSYYTAITDLIEILKYKMVWKSKPTYFFKIDSEIDERKEILMSTLQRNNLIKFFEKSYHSNVKWMYIDNIEVYEFSSQLTEQQIEVIDDIIYPKSMKKQPLYIVKEFVWHKLCGDYIDIDTLAMDICAEEWRRYRLLDNYSFNEVLQMDLANRDYRDPYSNEYLDKYLTILMSKQYPELLTDSSFDYILPDRNDQLVHYFINRFGNKISKLYAIYQREKIYYEKYDIPVITPSNSEIVLKDDSPSFDTLKETLPKYGSITFILSNYQHFTDDVFCYLLNNLNREQIYSFDFKNGFSFEIPQEVKPVQTIIFPNQVRKIAIRFERCNKKYSESLNAFLKYLLELFSEIAKCENVDLWLTFSHCEDLNDCIDFQLIGTVFKSFASENTNFSAAQYNDLSLSMTEQSKFRFLDCDELKNEHVMKLIVNSNIDVQNFTIEGKTSCSPELIFNLAEYLMDKEGVTVVKFQKFRNIIEQSNFLSMLAGLEFCRIDDVIKIQKGPKNKKKVLDVFYFLNGLDEDESPPFDYD